MPYPPAGPPPGSPGDITRLLGRWRAGDEGALGELAPLVYEQLREQAARYLRRERGGHTLEPTAVVHEAFLRLHALDRLDWVCRDQFFAVAATTMRRLLVDHARRRIADKRGSDAERVSITLAEGAGDERSGDRWLDVLDVDRALARLEKISERRARVVELRFFAGLEQREIAALLGVSEPTIEREWRAARAWLSRALATQSAETPVSGAESG